MSNKVASIDVVEMMRDATLVVEVKRRREWSIRWWIAMRLMMLAARIANMNIQIEDEGT